MKKNFTKSLAFLGLGALTLALMTGCSSKTSGTDAAATATEAAMGTTTAATGTTAPGAKTDHGRRNPRGRSCILHRDGRGGLERFPHSGRVHLHGKIDQRLI